MEPRCDFKIQSEYDGMVLSSSGLSRSAKTHTSVDKPPRADLRALPQTCLEPRELCLISELSRRISEGK